MTMIGEKTFKVVNVQNGGIYVIGESKLKKEVGLWEMFIEPQVEPEDKKPTANEIKVLLKEKGVEFKGNAKLEDLEKLLLED